MNELTEAMQRQLNNEDKGRHDWNERDTLALDYNGIKYQSIGVKLHPLYKESSDKVETQREILTNNTNALNTEETDSQPIDQYSACF